MSRKSFKSGNTVNAEYLIESRFPNPESLTEANVTCNAPVKKFTCKILDSCFYLTVETNPK